MFLMTLKIFLWLLVPNPFSFVEHENAKQKMAQSRQYLGFFELPGNFFGSFTFLRPSSVSVS